LSLFSSTQVIERRLLAEVLNQLNAVRLWFEEQRHYLFYATSLLLVYDAELLKKGSNILNVRIRMIDFAHVFPAHDSQDSNYLEGLYKLIEIISSIQ
jgi:1D-myo-inositol-tetrakisphosphate 5-kinase/inositol-polyphosphate multikinase